MPGAPGSGRGGPMLEQAAQDAIASARPRTHQWPPYDAVPVPGPPLTAEERAKADEVAKANRYCQLCGAVHALPSTAACPRLASFELDADGNVKSGTFFEGVKWAKGRAIFIEDLSEEDGDA